MKRIFFVTLAICALLITSSALASNRIVSTMFVVNCRQSITLRAAPSVYAREITQIPLGQAVGFIESAGNGFYKINYDGAIGYALAEYLSADRSGAAIGGTVVNCRVSITLRDAPSVQAYELMQIPLGERVTVIYGEDTDSFYKVRYRGVTGYVLKTYIRLDR